MDIIRDNSWNTLLQISSRLSDDLPPYVRQYTPLTKESASNLSDNLFADSRNRMFPIDSEGSTWTSIMYFNHNKDSLGYKQAEHAYINNRLMQAAQIYGIEKDAEVALRNLLVVEEKVAEDTDSEFPMHDATGVRKAAAYFTNYSRKYPQEWRKTMAHTIMRKAASFEVPMEDLGKTVMTEAGYGIPNVEDLRSNIAYRVHMAKDAQSAELLVNLNNIIDSIPITEVPLDKVASVLADFDAAEGLDREYNKKLMPPAHSVYGIDVKSASNVLEDAVKLGRNTFSATKLASVFNPADLDNLLGEAFSKDLVVEGKLVPTKLASTLNQLPPEDKLALDEYIRNAFAQ